MDSEVNNFSDIVDSGFFGFFNKLPPKSDTTIRFFNRIDFYAVHGKDALFVAKEVFKSISSVKIFDSAGSKYESVALNKNQFEALIRDLLLVHHYRVEVYSPRGGVKTSDWFLERKASPGNLSDFEDIVHDSEFAVGSAVMGIKVAVESKTRIVGVAIVDLFQQKMIVCQFQDDDNFFNLEGFIVQEGPKEILVPDSPEYSKVSRVVPRGLIVKTKPANFTSENITQDLNKLLDWEEGQVQNASALPEMKLPIAVGALNAVIKYLELSGKDYNFKLSTAEPKRFVHVDVASAKALGLIPQQASTTQDTLISFLNKCRTAQGKRLLSQWVKQPLKDLRMISERLDVVSVFVDDSELRMSLSEEHLRWFPDGQLLVRKLQKKNSTLQDCYKLYRAVERISPLLEALKAGEYCAAIKDNFLNPLQELNEDLSNFREMIATTLDMDQVAKGEFLVKASFSDELSELKSCLTCLEEEIDKELTKASRDLQLEPGKTIKLEITSQHGYHFRTANKKRARRDVWISWVSPPPRSEATQTVDLAEGWNFFCSEIDSALKQSECISLLDAESATEIEAVADNIILMGDFHAHVGSEPETSRGVLWNLNEEMVEPKIRNNYNFKFLDSTNAGIRFQSKTLTELNQDYLEKKREYDECQKTVVNDILEIAGGYVSPILTLNEVIAKLDVLTSFALVAANAITPYVRPQLRPMEDGVLRLKEARHPMLEAQDSISVIPNDIVLEKNNITFCIITGPNMGGKSTYIRTVGVNVLLAHIGSFVSCTEAEISLKDSILARIGSTDRQSIGVSTFMNEMVEITAILGRATENSLVMIDELGRGTSTFEGCGLAWAIASHLASKVKAFSLFATHFQELIALAEEIPTVANFHVSAMTGEELTMLYKVCPGPSDRSFGLEVAKMAGFKEHVLQDARQKLMELDQKAGLSLNGVPLTLDEIKEGKKVMNEFFEKIKGKGAEDIKTEREKLLKQNSRYITAILS